MFKKIFFGMAALAMLTACNEDFTDWADPQHNDQPATVAFGDGSVTEVGVINLANVEESTVQACQITAPTASNTSDEYTPEYKLNITAADGTVTSFDMDENGNVNASELNDYIHSNYGYNPVERDMNATVEMWLTNGSSTVKTATSGSFQVKAIGIAPVIYPHLYVIGAPSEWSTTCTTLPFTHSDKDVYEDPEFTVMFPVTDGDVWFAFIDDYTVGTGSWSDVFAAKEGNGLNKVGETGELCRRSALSEDAGDGSFKVTVNGDAKFIKVTVNMLEQTYLIEKINFDPYVYFIGSTDGWTASDQKLASPNNDGVYTGFIYVADPNGWGLAGKFQKTAGSWDDQINAGNLTGGMTGVTGTDNIEFPAEGVYYITLDLTQNSINAVQVTTMGIIGDFNGWGGDAVMTWDAANYCYVCENPGITANGWKFRVNGGWDINLGGALDNLVGNGDNLSVVGNTVKLYPTRKTNDNIYCTVE